MSRDERPDRVITENVQPTAAAPVLQTPNFGPGIRPFNNGDILVDIDGADIDFYYVVSIEDNKVILNNGEGPMGIKTKLVDKLVRSGGWKVYTEGFKIQQSVETAPPQPESPPPKKANKQQRIQEERPDRR